MKKVCDHCGGGIEKERDDIIVVWCRSCVDEDYELLNAAGLSAAGTPMIFNKGYGEFSAGMTKNIERMKAIPPKGAKSSAATTVVSMQAQVDFESKPTAPIQQEPAFDFDKYNSTIPGRHYGSYR
jgi:hypothetical protein